MPKTVTVVAHDIPENNFIGTKNVWISLVPISLLMKTHIGTVTRKTCDNFCCLILSNQVTGLGKSIGVNIGRISKDGTIF